MISARRPSGPSRQSCSSPRAALAWSAPNSVRIASSKAGSLAHHCSGPWRSNQNERTCSIILASLQFAREQRLRPRELCRRIDAERDRVDEGDLDTHPVFKHAKLLQPLAPLQRAGRERDEAGQRLASVGVEANMVPERAFARGRGRAGEIERAALGAARLACETTALTTFGSDRSAGSAISAASVPTSTAGSANSASARAGNAGSMVGRSPCKLTTASCSPAGSIACNASKIRSEPEA